ncbi:MAG: PKD domain-containing protein [Flavobacteriales bacterium]|nr:PKD domain-containing protein [Flavobacteriales bacterium]
MMKKLLFTFVTGAFLASASFAQSNLDLENWTGNSCDAWGNLNSFMFLGAPQTTFQETTDPGKCASAAMIETGYWLGATGFGASSDTVSGFLTIGGAPPGVLGIPYTGTPTSLSFMYKSKVIAGDTAMIYVQLSHWDTTAGVDSQIVDAIAVFESGDTNSGGWQSVTIPFFYLTADTSDTLQIICVSSKGTLQGGIPLPLIGSQLYVDAFGLNGVCNTTEACFGTTGVGLSRSFAAGASNNPNATYSWDFGNATTGSGLSASVTYATGGNYNVCLTVTDSCGSDTVCSMMDACSAPTDAAFTSSIDTLDVSFTSTGTANSNPTYAWDFGDGSTGTGATSSHTYADSGMFTVCLTITDDCGTDSSCSSVTVAIPTGINDDLTIKGFNVYPNPASDFITVTIGSANVMDIQLYDLRGSLVLDVKHVSAGYKIARADYAKGGYLVKVTSEGKQASKYVVFE